MIPYVNETNDTARDHGCHKPNHRSEVWTKTSNNARRLFRKALSQPTRTNALDEVDIMPKDSLHILLSEPNCHIFYHERIRGIVPANTERQYLSKNARIAEIAIKRINMDITRTTADASSGTMISAFIKSP